MRKHHPREKVRRTGALQRAGKKKRRENVYGFCIEGIVAHLGLKADRQQTHRHTQNKTDQNFILDNSGLNVSVASC